MLSHLCVILILGQVVTQRPRRAQQRGPLPVGAHELRPLALTAPKAEADPGARLRCKLAFQPPLRARGPLEARGAQFSSGALGKALNLLSCAVKPQISGGIWET